MSDIPAATSSISLPAGFEFGAVSPHPGNLAVEAHSLLGAVPLDLPPSLGPLAAFVGKWEGSGFNTIFRPQSPNTPTQFPNPVVEDGLPKDNVLELNLTDETLSFSQALGSVPNRGTVQADAFLNGVSYLQVISDVTFGAPPVGIHVEPGLWMMVPATTEPSEGPTITRMGSIPHGTTIQAQGTSTEVPGPPVIPQASIQPFLIGGSQGPGNAIPKFSSQTVTNQATARIPQDLTSFIAAGTLTQAMLDDPNSVLRAHNQSQKITHTRQIDIATAPAAPLFGGGTGNIAFLLGDGATPLPAKPNAHAITMKATFWIETVEITLIVPIFKVGQPALLLRGGNRLPGRPEPVFTINPPIDIHEPRKITLHYTQIQYSQTVVLNFAGLSWPHVSVATLVPSNPLPVPATVWA